MRVNYVLGGRDGVRELFLLGSFVNLVVVCWGGCGRKEEMVEGGW